MTSFEIKNARIPGGGSASIFIQHGLIAAGGRRAGDMIDGRDLLVLPGFVDIHNHGAVGVDVNRADVDGLLRVGRFLAANGVTAWMPTLVPDTDENYARVIGVIDEVMAVQGEMPIAQIVGVHYEGVFAAHAMCGALRAEYFKSGLWAAGGGRLPRLKRGVHMMTLAPEIEGGIKLIETLVADGWVVSIGHTAADAATLDRAFATGARHMTHFFNAMTGLHHRELGVAGWGLANRGVTFDIIADGVHVHPEMLGVVCRAKTSERVSLISDSVAPTGLGDGEFDLWGEKITVKNRRTRNKRGSIAGSVCTMLDCVHTMRSVGFADVDVAMMSSRNPARLVGIDKDRGTLEVGMRADIVAMAADGKIGFTMIGGVMVNS